MRAKLLSTTIALLVAGCSSSGGGTVITVLGYTVTLKTAPPTTAQIGASVPIAFTVTENESDGSSKAASGKSFTVTVTSGGGTINGGASAVLTTGADGSISLTWVLGSSVGTQSVRGSVSSDHYLDVSLSATAPPPTQIGFTTAPSASAPNGAAFAQQPSVQIKDASGNPVAQSGVAVTVSIDVGGGTLAGGPLTVNTDANGRATFTGLMITGLAGARTLKFAATLNGTAVTLPATVTVTAGSATQLVLATLPSITAQSGVNLAQQPSVQLEDASGNPVAQAGVPVAATIDVGGGTLGGTVIVNTNASGIAVFNGLSISGIVGNRVLKFTATLAGSAATVSTASIAVAAGPAAQLTVKTQPALTPVIGFTMSLQPAVQVRDAAGNPLAQGGIVVTASVATGTATLAGTATATTDGTGAATFTNLKFIGNTGAATLGFAATLSGQAATVASGLMSVVLPANGKIVFKSANDALWVVNPDGSGLNQLTPGYGNSTCTAGDEEPRWSPDGTKIVFTRTQNGAQEIWTMNADGSNQTRLTNSGSAGCLDESLVTSTWSENPSWSPDGTKIIFTSDRSTTSIDEDLWIMNADGTNQVKFFGAATAAESEGVFSPDGKTIVFQIEPYNPTGCSGITDGGEIWFINSDGTNPRRKTTSVNCSFEENYTWAPDGSKVYYTASVSTLPCGDEVTSVTSDPNITVKIGRTSCLGGAGSEHPIFSPDGTKVVFANGSGGDTIWFMNPDGSAPTQVPLGVMVDNGEPAWQPVLPAGAGIRRAVKTP